MYAISLIDRTNLGLAAVAGMNQDLKLDGDKYTIIIMLFFVMYIIFESKSSSLYWSPRSMAVVIVSALKGQLWV